MCGIAAVLRHRVTLLELHGNTSIAERSPSSCQRTFFARFGSNQNRDKFVNLGRRIHATCGARCAYVMKIDFQGLRACGIEQVGHPFEHIGVRLVVSGSADTAPFLVERDDNGGAVGELSPRDICEVAEQPILERRTGIDDLDPMLGR